MKLSLLCLCIVVLTYVPASAQVALATNPTLTFTNATGFEDNIVADGEGGSVSITDFNIIATPINAAGATLTADPVQYHDSDDWPGYPPIITYGDINPHYAWSIRSVGGANFSLLSVDVNDWGSATGDPLKIEAYSNGSLTASFTFPSNVDISVNITLSQSATDPDFLLPEAFNNVDEVRILMDDESDAFLGINNIQVGPTGVVLPLTLISFSAELEEDAVRLNWKTAQEYNVSHFEIEYSDDGREYNKIGEVASSSNGDGNYTYLDNVLRSSMRYYRMKMVDQDLTYTYSHTIFVRQEAAVQMSLYPNPASSVVHLTLPKLERGSTQIRVLNMQGMPVNTTTLTSQGQATVASINVSGLPAGTYFIQVISSNAVKHRTSFIKQ